MRFPPKQLVARSGVYRSSGGSNEAVEAFDVKDRCGGPTNRQAETEQPTRPRRVVLDASPPEPAGILSLGIEWNMALPPDWERNWPHTDSVATLTPYSPQGELSHGSHDSGADDPRRSPQSLPTNPSANCKVSLRKKLAEREFRMQFPTTARPRFDRSAFSLCTTAWRPNTDDSRDFGAARVGSDRPKLRRAALRASVSSDRRAQVERQASRWTTQLEGTGKGVPNREATRHFGPSTGQWASCDFTDRQEDRSSQPGNLDNKLFRPPRGCNVDRPKR
jgi:hypothetical protein